MHRSLTIVIAFIAVVGCHSQNNKSRVSTMQTLFDGQTTKGWHKYGSGPVGPAWKIADGTLYLDATEKENGKIKGGGDIVTDEEYENFELHLEWKISKGGNSGIMFCVHEDTTGPKCRYWITTDTLMAR